MNLLDKHSQKGLAILPALFLLFFACEEPSELGVGLNPKEDEISTHYLEIPLEASQVRIDTIVSSSSIVNINQQTGAAALTPVLIGKNENPTFGSVTATAYTNIGTPTSIPVIPESASIDSVYLYLSHGNSYIGQDTSSLQTLKIFRLENAIEPTSGAGTSKPQYKYFITDSEPLAEQIGEVTFTPTGKPSGILQIRLDGENAMGSDFVNELFNKLKTDTTIFNDQQRFNEQPFSSLAIVPGENNTFINSYNIAGSSRIALYYGGNATPVTFPFLPEIGEDAKTLPGDYQPTYFHLDTDFSGTVFENAPSGSNVEFQNTDNQVYFRAGVGLFPKFTFSGLEDFVNSNLNSNIVINKALLEIDSVYNTNSIQNPPEQAYFHFVEDENNRRFGMLTEANGVGVMDYAGAPLSRFRKDDQDSVYRYSGDITEEVERYVQTEDPRFLQGIIYPATYPISLLSFILEPEKIKLKLYYTLLKEENN